MRTITLRLVFAGLFALIALGGASYYHEAEVTDVGTNVSTVTRGIMTVKRALT